MRVPIFPRHAFIGLVFFVSFVLATPQPALAVQNRATAGPTITFGPTYPGHDQGVAEGAVGSLVHLAASNLGAIPGWNLAQTPSVTVSVIPLEQEGTLACSQPQASLAQADVPLDPTANGSFAISFPWPARATKANGPLYVACLHPNDGATGSRPPTGQDYLSATPGDAIPNPGLFQALTNAPAQLAISPASAQPGETITITGQNWAPSYADDGASVVNIALGRCNTEFGLGSTTAVAGSNGIFTASITLAAAAPVGTYQACAYTSYQHVDNLPSSSQAPPALTIQAAASATAPTPAPAQSDVIPTPTFGGDTATPPTPSRAAVFMDPSLLGFLGALGLIVVTLIALKLLGRRPPAELASAPVWPAPQEQTDPYPAVPAKPKAPAKRKAAARAPKPAARTAKRQRAPVFWDS